jgi:hypothetical protein
MKAYENKTTSTDISHNELYMMLYVRNKQGRIDKDLIMNELQSNIDKLYESLKLSHSRSYLHMNVIVDYIERLEKYMSMFDKTIVTDFCDYVARMLFDNNETFISQLVDYLLNKEQLDVFNHINKLFGKSVYSLDVVNPIYDKFVVQIAKKLNYEIKRKIKYDDQLDDMVDIEHIFSIINNIGIYFADVFKMPNTNQLYYATVYGTWIEILISKLTPDAENMVGLMQYLQSIQPYTTEEDTLQIADRLAYYANEYINDHMANNKCFKSNQQYVALCEVMNIVYLFVEKYKHPEAVKKVLSPFNTLFSNRQYVEYFNISIKRFICEECAKKYVKMGQVAAEFPKKYINSLALMLYLQEADYCLMTFHKQLQLRYLAMMSNNKLHECTQMYLIDQVILSLIIKELDDDNNCHIKEHLNKTVIKIEEVLKDISTSFTAIKEIHTCSITYVNDKNYEQEYKPTYVNSDILYTLTTNYENWTELTSLIKNNVTLKANINKDIKYITNTFDTYFRHKCVHRKLNILNDSSTLIMKYTLGEKSYNIKVTLLQAIILKRIASSEAVSALTLCKYMLANGIKIKSEINHIKTVCASLVQAKIIVSDPLMANRYSISQTFENDINDAPSTYVNNIAAYYYKEISLEAEIMAEDKSIADEVQYDRVNTMRCYIIKQLKGAVGAQSKKEIYDEVAKKLTLFKYTDNELFKEIDHLDKKFYIEHNKTTNRYTYSSE